MSTINTDGSRWCSGVWAGVTLSSSQNITARNGIAPSGSSCSTAGCCCCHRNRLRGQRVTDVWLRAVRGLKVGGGRGGRSLGVERRVREREAAGSTDRERTHKGHLKKKKQVTCEKDHLYSHVGGGKGLLPPSSIHKRLARIHILHLWSKQEDFWVFYVLFCDTVTYTGRLWSSNVHKPHLHWVIWSRCAFIFVELGCKYD